MQFKLYQFSGSMLTNPHCTQLVTLPSFRLFSIDLTMKLQTGLYVSIIIYPVPIEISIGLWVNDMIGLIPDPQIFCFLLKYFI